MTTNRKQFTDYCLSFYGDENSIYKLGVTAQQIRLATDLYCATGRDFCGDTVDRENIRDIILAASGQESA